MKVEATTVNGRRRIKVDSGRRKVVKLIAAGGAAAIASPFVFHSARAAGRPIKIGQITPETGPIAAFGQPSKWVADQVMKFLGDGIVVAGEKHPVQIINRDSQSDPNRASEVAADLINNENVDIMVASSTSDTVNPASPASPRTIRGSRGSSVARAIRRRASSGPIISSGVSIRSPTCMPTCG